MKTFVPIAVTVYSPKAIKQPKVIQCRWAAKRSMLKRFQRFIVSVDWEDQYLCNQWIDRMCLGGIVVFALYFSTSLVVSFLK